MELCCPPALADTHPFSRILAGGVPRLERGPGGSASATCYAHPHFSHDTVLLILTKAGIPRPGCAGAESARGRRARPATTWRDSGRTHTANGDGPVPPTAGTSAQHNGGTQAVPESIDTTQVAATWRALARLRRRLAGGPTSTPRRHQPHRTRVQAGGAPTNGTGQARKPSRRRKLVLHELRWRTDLTASGNGPWGQTRLRGQAYPKPQVFRAAGAA